MSLVRSPHGDRVALAPELARRCRIGIQYLASSWHHDIIRDVLQRKGFLQRRAANAAVIHYVKLLAFGERCVGCGYADYDGISCTNCGSAGRVVPWTLFIDGEPLVDPKIVRPITEAIEGCCKSSPAFAGGETTRRNAA